MARGRKRNVAPVDKRIACIHCGSMVTVLGGQYIYCEKIKKRIPVAPDGTPHNRILNAAGEPMRNVAMTTDKTPVYVMDADDKNFRVTESGGWYFVPENCPRRESGAA